MNTSITQQNFYVFKQEKSYCSTVGTKEKGHSVRWYERVTQKTLVSIRLKANMAEGRVTPK